MLNIRKIKIDLQHFANWHSQKGLRNLSSSFDFLMKNKSKQVKKHLVPTDEPFVDNENLVTGAKFNYDRPQATQREIEELCVPETFTRKEKFQKILIEGDKIQKWSIFQNYGFYVHSSSDSEFFLEKIIKNYPLLIQFLPVLADGLQDFLASQDHTETTLESKRLFELTFLVLKQNPDQVENWAGIFHYLAQRKQASVDVCLQYINGSFAMNSPPERRRVALEMMEGLLQVRISQQSQFSRDVEQSAHSKVLFFNQDQKSKTRKTICLIIHKLLLKNPKDEELWKAIWEYFHDKDQIVKETAIKALTSVNFPKNFKDLVSLFSESEEEIIIKNIQTFLLTFKANFMEDHKARVEFIAFCNRVFKSRNISQTCSLLRNLKREVMSVIGMSRVHEQLNFALLNLKEREVVEQLFNFYHEIEPVQFKQTLKFFILRGLKDQKYQIHHNANSLASLLDLHHEEEINIYTNVCNNLLDNSRWHQLVEMLKVIRQIQPFYGSYQKLSSMVLRVLLGAPVFMLQQVFDCIVHLLIINRRSLQLLITIRQKILNSKFWVYRKNYILLYRALKMNTSFEYQKLIPNLLYKSILSEKSYGVKLTFLEAAPDIYKYTEPSVTAEKNTLRETVSKLLEDKDSYVKESATRTLWALKKIDSDSSWLSSLYNRNRELLEQEEAIRQIMPDPKKSIKTQTEIKKSMTKKRTVETRKTINIGKGEFHKDASIESLNSTSLHSKILQADSKRPNLFRCHSVKIKVPNKKK